MYSWNLEKERLEAEAYLTGPRADFVTTYMTVANLQFIIKQSPELLTQHTATALLAVLRGTEHESQKQVFFLYKKAADGLGDMIRQTLERDLARAAKNALIHVLTAHTGKPCRAAAEALGTVPLSVQGPLLPEMPRTETPPVSWRRLLGLCGFGLAAAFSWKGRNLLVTAPDKPHVLVLKMARLGEDPSGLGAEGRWMEFLLGLPEDFFGDGEGSGPAGEFQVPRPVRVSDAHVFRITDFPLPLPPEAAINSNIHAVGFTAPLAYFRYPNEPEGDTPLPAPTFYEIMGRNARLLGRLTARGIIHTAPIPLFHNRVQRERREDRGLYQWPRAGRLDRWLSSCRYPNIGGTGIRDFEHFISFSGPSRQLYEHIGTHVLGLILVAGSYFRNKAPDLTGFDDGGSPVDARHLFDAGLFADTVKSIFMNYYEGFTEKPFAGSLPVDLGAFVSRLIDEMGVDRHMEEILRVAEQTAMTEEAFCHFLKDRGFSDARINAFEKGRADIPILTGPHLGGFNQPISVPELIEFTGATAALCVADRYFQVKFSERG